MIEVRRGSERGETRWSWLDSKHSFSFGNYYDPKHMGFRSLRVINDDYIDGGGKFGMHPHQDMEIITWVLKGSIVHEDTSGGRGVIRPGDAQKMSAGSGIYHSEANGSAQEQAHMLQIWIQPAERGIAPEYGQTHFPVEERTNCLRLVAGRDGRNGSILIHQDAELYNGLLDAGAKAELSLAEGRFAWIHVATGSLKVNGIELKGGDGAAVRAEPRLEFEASEASEVLVFDLG